MSAAFPRTAIKGYGFIHLIADISTYHSKINIANFVTQNL